MDFILGYLFGSFTSDRRGAPITFTIKGLVLFVVGLSLLTGVLYFFFWDSGDPATTCEHSSFSAMANAMCQLESMSGLIALSAFVVAAIGLILLMMV